MGSCSLLSNKKVGAGKFYRDSEGREAAARRNKETRIWEEVDFPLL